MAKSNIKPTQKPLTAEQREKQREAGRRWRSAHLTEAREKDREYKAMQRALYPEHVRELQARWRDRPDRREEAKERSRLWRQNHPNESKANARKQYQNNRERYRAYSRRRKALKRALPATLTVQEWEDIKAYFNYACAYCGRGWHEIDGVLEQEHVIPLSQGGGYTKENIVPACRSCNSGKHDRTPEQVGMSLLKPWPPPESKGP